MESILAVGRSTDGVHRHGSRGLGASKRFLIMRALARHHQIEPGLIKDDVDVEEIELLELLDEMRESHEVEFLLAMSPGGGDGKRREVRLTLDGWLEYLSILESLYQFPE